MTTSDRLGFDSAMLAPADQFDAYRAIYGPDLDIKAIDGGIGAIMTGWRLDRAVIYDRRMRGLEHRRDAACARRADMSHLTLTLLVAGTYHVDAGDGWRQLHPGEIVVLDMTCPTANRVPDGHVVTLSIARERIAALGHDPRRLHGSVIAAVRGAALADQMRMLARGGGMIEPQAMMTILRGIAALLAVSLGLRSPARRMVDQRRDEVRAMIEARLLDAEFGTETVTATVPLSRATLYRDFEPWGGLANYIRARRIDLLRDRLADPRETRSLAVLADELGFSTEARLSEAFLGRFGMRPGAYRRTVRSEAGAATAVRQMREWQMALR